MDRTDQITLAVAGEKLAEGLRLLQSAGLVTAPEQIYKQFFRRDLLNEIRAQSFKTNDLVTLVGAFRGGRKELRVNAAIIELDLREFTVLFVLGRSFKRRLAGERAAESYFLPVDELLDEIDLVRQQERIPEDQWRDPSAEDIRKVVSSLRKKIAAIKGNANLIESGQRGEGYRLSTPAENVDLPSLTTQAGGETQAEP